MHVSELLVPTPQLGSNTLVVVGFYPMEKTGTSSIEIVCRSLKSNVDVVKRDKRRVG